VTLPSTAAATTGATAAAGAAGVVNLPSTSTSRDTDRTPLVALGIALMAGGGALLARRRESVIG
jgi:LPXTG-motif cell wall-anchored protein